jgi:hypothetical protein
VLSFLYLIEFSLIVINGEEINNYYGLVEFINENGQKERGYIFDVKIKDKISFKLLKNYGY